jgi:hypothetical protein
MNSVRHDAVCWELESDDAMRRKTVVKRPVNPWRDPVWSFELGGLNDPDEGGGFAAKPFTVFFVR